MSNLLVCTVLATRSNTLIADIIKAATDCQCAIIDIRSSVLANEQQVGFVVAGHWNALAKFEHQANLLATKLSLHLYIKRSQQSEDAPALPYTVQIFASEQPGLLADVTTFFSQQNISIQEMFANTYLAHQTNTPVTVVNLAIAVPHDMHINMLRDAFQMFCDEVNVDGILEPIKN